MAATVLIAVTGYGQERNRRHALAAGFDHYLVKPLDAKKLAFILTKIGVSWLFGQKTSGRATAIDRRKRNRAKLGSMGKQGQATGEIDRKIATMQKRCFTDQLARRDRRGVASIASNAS